jgi:hypothetical protein
MSSSLVLLSPALILPPNNLGRDQSHRPMKPQVWHFHPPPAPLDVSILHTAGDPAWSSLYHPPVVQNQPYTVVRYIKTVPQHNLKGLSHEIFWPVFWAAWMHLGLNVNRLWFLNFNDAPLILDNYF